MRGGTNLQTLVLPLILSLSPQTGRGTRTMVAAVIPAKAGIQSHMLAASMKVWFPGRP
jgi:hypothetical protein